MVNFLKTNPGILAILVIVGIATFVLSFVGYGMVRSTGNGRPVVFFVVFMAIILIPNLVGQLVTAKRPAPAVRMAKPSAFNTLTGVFGADAQPAMIQNAKAVFPDFFAAASQAQLCMYTSGATVTVAWFDDKQALLDAVGAYMRAYGAKNLKGDEQKGWRGKRTAANDFVEIYRTPNELFIWTAPTEELLAQRRAASEEAIRAIAPPPPQLMWPVFQPLVRLFDPVLVKVASVLLLVLIASAWFFKGSAWASRFEATPGVQPVTADALRERLMSIQSLDTPMAVAQSEDGREVDVTWKYADAKWIDLARAHGLKRTHRLKLLLDESDHTVRVLEQSSAYDWSAGISDASLKWETSRGINFFEYRHERVFGLQFTPDGKPTADLSYSYTFDLQELKSPVIETVTRVGWTWQPTMLDVPKGLRWLTE